MTHIKDDTAEAVVLKEWVLNLESTDMPQIVGDLAEYGDCDCNPVEDQWGISHENTCASLTAVTGVCAIGVGTYHILGEADVENEVALAERMGIDCGFHIDWPSGLADPNGVGYGDGTTVTASSPRYVANLNDVYELKFSQIADLIRHFGLVSKEDA